MKNIQKSKLSKIVLTLVLMVITILLLVYLPYDKVQDLIKRGGIRSPLIYIALFALLPVFFFPVPVLAVAGGLAFGLWKGSLYTLIGAGINCILMFIIARYLGKEGVDKLVDSHISDRMKEKFFSNDKSLTFFIFTLRLIPVVPYALINYMSGLSNISLKNYTLASILGIIPGTMVFLNMGDKSANFKSQEFFISIILLVALIVISNLLAKYLKKQGKI